MANDKNGANERKYPQHVFLVNCGIVLIVLKYLKISLYTQCLFGRMCKKV